MRSVSHRIAALAVMTFFVGAQLGAAAHEEREHAVCPEHGERIHVDEAGAELTAVPSWSARSAEEAHADHCLADFSVESSQQNVRATTAVASPPLGTPATRTHFAVAPIALLRLAPKSSPPIA